MFITINENGEVYDQDLKLTKDSDVLEEFFYDLQVNKNFQLVSRFHGEPVLVEAFDEPLIVTQIQLNEGGHKIAIRQGCSWDFELSSLSLDLWDRFHGLTTNGIPFVLTPKAQDDFFNQLDEFDDDSIQFNEKTYPIPSYWQDEKEVESSAYWSDRYKQQETGWDLGQPAEGLKSILPKLKLPHLRVLVLGGGLGHDAAFFAQQGHRVTILDLSPEAIEKAKKLYGHFDNLQFVQGDLFSLSESFHGQFDLIFEHTCFCAINPIQRTDIIKVWRQLLSENGHLLGVFFTMNKKEGPPFGGSEWEIKKLFHNKFQPLIWQRLRNSLEPRQGKELLVYAKKIETRI